jgi:type IV pilus assembly protein PilV
MEVWMRILKKQDGQTLAEILIALTIFAIGLLAVAGMQASAIKMNSTAGKLTQLSTLGMNKIEELSVLPYAHPLLDPAGNPHQELLGDYIVSWMVIENDPVTNSKNITVTVTGQGKRADIGFLKPN